MQRLGKESNEFKYLKSCFVELIARLKASMRCVHTIARLQCERKSDATRRDLHVMDDARYIRLRTYSCAEARRFMEVDTH